MIFLLAYIVLRKAGVVKNAVVAAKLRIVFSTWPKEIKKWNLPITYRILHGSKKDEYFEEDVDLYLINYEGLAWLETKLKRGNKHKFDVLCLDESSKIKNTKSKRFKIIKRIHGLFKRRYIMTGSPAPNGLKDIFGQIFFLDGGKTLGKYITKFLADHFYPCGFKGYDWQLIKGEDKVIYNKIKPLVLRFSNDLLDLPPLKFHPIKVELPPKAMRFYKELEKEFIASVEDGFVVADTAASATIKLRQVTSGNVYGEQKAVLKVHEEKLEALKELVEEFQGSPCIVSYEFRHELDMLLEAFPNTPYIGGGVSAAEGTIIEDQWNAGELPILFGNPASIAHGLNLQESGTDLVMFSLTWNLEDYEQLYQRLWRQGQKNPVNVYHLIAEGTIDEAILKALESKDKTQKTLLKALESHYDFNFKKKGGSKMKDKDEVLKKFVVISQVNSIGLPNYYSGNMDMAVRHLEFLVAHWSHGDHKDFTGSDSNELSVLFKETMKMLEEPLGMLMDYDQVKGTTFRANKKVFKTITDSKTKKLKLKDMEIPSHLIFDGMKTQTKDEESTMTKSKFASKKKSVVKKAPVKKKSVVKKEPVAKKKASPKAKKVESSKPTKKVSSGSKYKVSEGYPEKGVHGSICKVLSKRKSFTIDAAVSACLGKIDHDKSEDEKFILGYVKGGIKRGYLVEA